MASTGSISAEEMEELQEAFNKVGKWGDQHTADDYSSNRKQSVKFWEYLQFVYPSMAECKPAECECDVWVITN